VNIIKNIAQAAKAEVTPSSKPVRQRVGCKVSWYYYDNAPAAIEASKAAVAEGWVQLSRGYDFGYCSPGEITKTGDSEWEVCFP
jgi:hypothetical protein